MKVCKFALKTIVLGALAVSLTFAKATITIETEKGNVEVPKNPKKVVVIDFGVLDTMELLGIKAELGVPTGTMPTNLVEYVKGAEIIGGLKEPNFEKIYELKPDLIIIGGRTYKSYDELSKIAPTLYYYPRYEHYTTDTMKISRDIGKIFDKEKEVEAYIQEAQTMQKELKETAQKSDKKVLFVLTNDGKISTYGLSSIYGFIYDDFGLKQVDKNIKVSKHGQSINYEYISEQNPDVILYVDRTKVIGGSKFGGDTLENKLVLETKAGKSNKIIPLSSDLWYLSYGGLGSYKTYIKEVQSAFK